MMILMDWQFIFGLKFTGEMVSLSTNISPAVVRSLLGIPPLALNGRVVCSGPLSIDASSGELSEHPPEDQAARDHILCRHFLTIMKECFIIDNSSIVSFSHIGALRGVDHIEYFDCGSFTFAYFLRGMRLRYEGVTEAWLGFYPFMLFWAYERLHCLRPDTILGLEVYLWDSVDITLLWQRSP